MLSLHLSFYSPACEWAQSLQRGHCDQTSCPGPPAVCPPGLLRTVGLWQSWKAPWWGWHWSLAAKASGRGLAWSQHHTARSCPAATQPGPVPSAKRVPPPTSSLGPPRRSTWPPIPASTDRSGTDHMTTCCHLELQGGAAVMAENAFGWNCCINAQSWKKVIEKDNVYVVRNAIILKCTDSTQQPQRTGTWVDWLNFSLKVMFQKNYQKVITHIQDLRWTYFSMVCTE